ncbi:hypothetical protein V9T40_000105 [Parthenolecanium corni]|uniref:Uncharacterized protein n=1 Tax=Parthenolecanium corni TaxID=536013 RepID=A0AAN9TFW4_9HEMI
MPPPQAMLCPVADDPFPGKQIKISNFDNPSSNLIPDDTDKGNSNVLPNSTLKRPNTQPLKSAPNCLDIIVTKIVPKAKTLPQNNEIHSSNESIIPPATKVARVSEPASSTPLIRNLFAPLNNPRDTSPQAFESSPRANNSLTDFLTRSKTINTNFIPVEVDPSANYVPDSVKAPRYQLPLCFGKLVDYPGWIKAFGQYIHCRTNLMIPQKIQLLIDHLDPKIGHQLKQFSTDEQGYEECLQFLDKRYGNISKLKIELFNRITDLYNAQASANSVRNTVDRLESLIVRYRKYAGTVDEEMLFTIVVCKFPPHCYQTTLSSKERHVNNLFAALREWIEIQEMDFSNVHVPLQANRWSSSRFLKNESCSKVPCMLCEQAHHTFLCTTINTLEARRVVLRNKQVCLYCLQPHHDECRQRPKINCKWWECLQKGMHNPALCTTIQWPITEQKVRDWICLFNEKVINRRGTQPLLHLVNENNSTTNAQIVNPQISNKVMSADNVTKVTSVTPVSLEKFSRQYGNQEIVHTQNQQAALPKLSKYPVFHVNKETKHCLLIFKTDVRSIDDKTNQIKVNGFLDSSSAATFILEKTARKLGLSGDVNLT